MGHRGSVPPRALAPSAGRSRRLAQRYAEFLGLHAIVIEPGNQPGLLKFMFSQELFHPPRAAPPLARYWTTSLESAQRIALEAWTASYLPDAHLALSLDPAVARLRDAAVQLREPLSEHTEMLENLMAFIERFQAEVTSDHMRAITRRYWIAKGRITHSDYSRFLERELLQLLRNVAEAFTIA